MTIIKVKKDERKSIKGMHERLISAKRAYVLAGEYAVYEEKCFWEKVRKLYPELNNDDILKVANIVYDSKKYQFELLTYEEKMKEDRKKHKTI